ncbi:MAG: aminopeptidase [Chloroflexi bacterium]|nr:aminopeptidase [Chloroflexota bacterium]
MKNPKMTEIAKILVNYSVKVKPGDRVLVHCVEPHSMPLVEEVYKEVLHAGGLPFVHIESLLFKYLLIKEGTEEQIEFFPPEMMAILKTCQCYISVRSSMNDRLLTNLDFNKVALYEKSREEYLRYRVDKTRWVATRYPTPTMAHDAGMATDEFFEFYYDAIIQDWNEQSKYQDKIIDLFKGGKKVRITGKDTDITFSIEGRKPIKCIGDRNMPDGELYFAPVADSTEGHIHFDFPAIHNGVEFPDLYLKFANGRVVEAKASSNLEKFEKLIDIDSGARRIGEFGIGTNFKIQQFIKNILFDEKIGGTIHLALGNAYGESGGGNDSAIHMDIIKDLRTNGKIELDDRVVQENGKFIFS